MADRGRRPNRAAPSKRNIPDATLVPASGSSILFIVPAYKRVELASICYRQFAHACSTLKGQGLTATVLVVADDGNIEAAEQAGLETLRHVNRLGAKLNAGYSYAAQNGYDYVCPVGSDSWIAPDRWAYLPAPGTMLCTRNYVCLSPDGTRQGWFRIDYDGGIGSRTFHVSMLEACRYKPLEGWRPNGCDTQTLRTITKHHGRPAFAYLDLHPFEIVGFQSEVQITDYERLVAQHLREWQEPFAGLCERFPAGLVDDVRRYYAERNVLQEAA